MFEEGAGRAFTAELCSVAWPGKFKPDLPPHYDGTADPTEFLQLYTWLLNLPPSMISSWDEIVGDRSRN